MRTITKLQTLLVLFLTTAMVCFMGCKDDDDDVPTPGGGGTVATYAISGTVMDASNNPMIGVSVALSGAQSLSATTGSDGTYSFDLKSTPGSYKIAFKSEGYVDRSYDVDVKKIESGVGQYVVNAVMVKGTTPDTPKEYKKAKYNLSVSIEDVVGKAISTSSLSVVVKYGDKEIAKENKPNFKVSDVTPGIYDVVATASGYTKAVAKVVVSAVPDQEKKEGEGDTFDVEYPAIIVMNVAPSIPVDPDDPSKPTGPSKAAYIVSGIITDLSTGADIKTADMLDLPVPTAVFHNISVKPSEIQRDMVAGLAERAERVRNGMVDARVDNMLKITNDGRKLALDQRMLNDMLPDFEGSKINASVDNIYRIWEETAE